MVKLIKSLFLFLLLLVLVFLLSSTFFTSNTSYDVVNLSEKARQYQSGYYSFSGSSNIVYQGNSKPDESELYMQKISRFDSIYASEESNSSDRYIVDVQENTVDISLGLGTYVISLSDPNKQYNISGPGFEIQPISYGSLYIDTRDISKATLFSFNISLDVSFLDTSNDNIVVTQAYLLPNRYIVFDSLRNNELTNADFLRISQVVSLYGYINGSIYTDNIIYDRFTRLLDTDAQAFLESVFQYMSFRSDLDIEVYQELNNITVWDFPGLDYIKEKLLLFKNDTKKSIFYKNIILAELDDLFGQETLSSQVTASIATHLKLLEGVDVDGYNEMIALAQYYASIVMNQSDYSLDVQKKNFKNLLAEIHNTPGNTYYSSLEQLADIYTHYNFVDNGSYLHDISDFSSQFLVDIGSEIEDNTIVVIEDNNTRLREYVSAFLQSFVTQQLLAAAIDKSSIHKDVLEGLLQIVNDNILLSTYVYFIDTQSASDSLKQTGLYQNLNFLIILDKFLANNLFDAERTDTGLLVVSDDNLVKNTLSKLDDNVDNIQSLYIQYKNIDSENTNKLLGYDSVGERLDEAFGALLNYELYRRQYEQEVKDVRDAGIFSDTDSGLSKESFIEYISQFSGVNTSRVEVEVQESEIYRVTQLYINGSNVDFYLYPFSGNRIEDIYIDSEKIIGSYVLDERQLDLEDKYKSASSSEKQQYDFARFFINTFFTERQEDVIIFEDDISSLTESKSVISFKKEKLLGDGKEFDFVKQYLPLKWENVVVSESYDISISGALYVNNDSRNQNYMQMNAGYLFSDVDHSFNNISLKLYDNYIENSGSKFLLNNTLIRFVGDVYIGDFNDISQDFFAQIGSITGIYNTLVRQGQLGDVIILYYPQNNNIKMSFALSGNNYELNILDENITYIKKDSKTVADNVKPSTLADVLNTLP